MSGWINQTWPRHTVEYYTSVKRRRVQTRAVLWMDLDSIILSERSQTRCVSSLREVFRIEMKKMMATEAWGGEKEKNRECLLMGPELFVGREYGSISESEGDDRTTP